MKRPHWQHSPHELAGFFGKIEGVLSAPGTSVCVVDKVYRAVVMIITATVLIGHVLLDVFEYMYPRIFANFPARSARGRFTLIVWHLDIGNRHLRWQS